MALEHVILGWLSTGPGSGYDLAKAMDVGFGWFWNAPHPQIYVKLKELEQKDLVKSQKVIVGERLEKNVFEITDAGRMVVDAWTAEPPSYPANRDVERTKLIFSDTGNLVALRQHFQAHIKHFQTRRDQIREFLAELTSRQHSRIESRIERAPSRAHGELSLALREFAYRGDLKRAENEISWAQDCLDWLDAFEVRWKAVDGHLPRPKRD